MTRTTPCQKAVLLLTLLLLTGPTLAAGKRRPPPAARLAAADAATDGPAADGATMPVANPCAAMKTGADASFGGFVPDPDDAWHRDVRQAPVAPNSHTFFARPSDLGNAKLHADFGTQVGIPYSIADSTTTPMTPINIGDYAAESDIAVAPVPARPNWEGAAEACVQPDSDQHMLVVDRKTCSVYEFYQAWTCNGQWMATSSAIFDLERSEQRPYGFTSTDASGLSVLEGLVRYDEIAAGHIDHALRFTARLTKRAPRGSLMTAPATHSAGNNGGTDNIMGMRIRLKADFDISRYSRTNQIILTAMKTYGMILADNGGTMFFTGTRDPRWDDDELRALARIPSSSFEVLQMGPVLSRDDAPRGPAPEIFAFTASPAVSRPGMPVLLNAVYGRGSYAYIDQTGFLRGGAVTVRPRQTTTYKLTVRNLYGSSTRSVTVSVQ